MIWLERDYNSIFKRWKIQPGVNGWQSDIAFEKDFIWFGCDWGVRVNQFPSRYSDFAFWLELTLFKRRFLFRYYHAIEGES